MDQLASKIANFIHAHQRRNIQQALFQKSNIALDNAKAELTESIPPNTTEENFIVTFDGDTYIVKIDIEGGHYHQILPVDAVLDL